MAGKGAAGAAGKTGEGDGTTGAAGAASGADDGAAAAAGAAGAAAGTAAGAADGSAAGDGAASGAAAGTGTAGDDKSFTQADLDRALAKQKKDLEKAAADAAAKAKLSEDERKDAELAELKTQIRMRDAKDEVMTALEKEGAQSKGLMWEGIKGQLEFDEKTGKLTNLKEVIDSLKVDYPDSFGTPKPTDGVDGGKGQQQKGDAITKEKLATMTPAQVAELPWEDVKKALAA